MAPAKPEALQASSTGGATVAMVAWLCTAAAACNVPEPPAGTGGTDVPAGDCGRGLVVVASDYQSTNVSLLGVHGDVLSSSFISSASTGTGLSAPLSGDVVVTTAPADGDEIVLIDRYPAAVLTFVQVQSGAVRAQLRVGTGFAANPQDYVAWSADRAYLSRLDPNASPGLEPFDGGSDLLLVDPQGPAIVGRVDLGAALVGLPSQLHARPGRLLRVGGRLVVLASPSSADFIESAEARLVVVNPAVNTVEQILVLTGLHGCSGLALSPSGGQLAVACSGRFEGGTTPTLADSGIAVVTVTIEPGTSPGGNDSAVELALAQRFAAAQLVGQPVGFALDFAGEDRLLSVAFGRFADGTLEARPDVLFEVELASGGVRNLLESIDVPFNLGEVRCTGGCADCYAADAERGVVHQFAVGAGGLEPVRSIVVDTLVGLPPRLLGRF